MSAEVASTLSGASCGTSKAGCGPKKKRPMKVAVPVASATGRKVRDADLGHHQLDGEHDAADRRIEGRRDTGAGAGGNENDPLSGGHSHDLAQGRSEGRADLDDRALASHRRAAADRNRRGQRLHDRDDGPDDTSLVVDRVHHLRARRGRAPPERI